MPERAASKSPLPTIWQTITAPRRSVRMLSGATREDASRAGERRIGIAFGIAGGGLALTFLALALPGGIVFALWILVVAPLIWLTSFAADPLALWYQNPPAFYGGAALVVLLIAASLARWRLHTKLRQALGADVALSVREYGKAGWIISASGFVLVVTSLFFRFFESLMTQHGEPWIGEAIDPMLPWVFWGWFGVGVITLLWGRWFPALFTLHACRQIEQSDAEAT